MTMLGRISIAIFAVATVVHAGTIPASAQQARAALRLVATDAHERYPFATVAMAGQNYHVTEGDVLAGVRIERIQPTFVVLSNRRVLRLPSNPQLPLERPRRALADTVAWTRFQHLRPAIRQRH